MGISDSSNSIGAPGISRTSPGFGGVVAGNSICGSEGPSGRYRRVGHAAGQGYQTGRHHRGRSGAGALRNGPQSNRSQIGLGWFYQLQYAKPGQLLVKLGRGKTVNPSWVGGYHLVQYGMRIGREHFWCLLAGGNPVRKGHGNGGFHGSTIDIAEAIPVGKPISIPVLVPVQVKCYIIWRFPTADNYRRI
jgi:hypothetical protein